MQEIYRMRKWLKETQIEWNDMKMHTTGDCNSFFFHVEAEQFFNDINVFELMLALLCGRYNKTGIKCPIKWNSWC